MLSGIEKGLNSRFSRIYFRVIGLTNLSKLSKLDEDSQVSARSCQFRLIPRPSVDKTSIAFDDPSQYRTKFSMLGIV